MKKRIVALALIIVLALTLTLAACGSKVNDENTKVAEDVVNTIDNYLDGLITARAAKEAIDEDGDKIDIDNEEDTASASYANVISIDITLMSVELSEGASSDTDYILEKRNDIASMAGLDKRK